MVIKRIDYVFEGDNFVPKYTRVLESVPENEYWYIKKVFVYLNDKWVSSSKYSYHNGIEVRAGVLKHCSVGVKEYFDMLVKYEGYGVESK